MSVSIQLHGDLLLNIGVSKGERTDNSDQLYQEVVKVK